MLLRECVDLKINKEIEESSHLPLGVRVKRSVRVRSPLRSTPVDAEYLLSFHRPVTAKELSHPLRSSHINYIRKAIGQELRGQKFDWLKG